MNPGTIFFKKDFEFIDGDSSDKLFVLLTPARNGEFLVVKTTSQPKPWRDYDQGCQAEKGYFYFPSGTSWFDVNTWVVLDDPLILDARVVLQWFKNGAAEVKTRLSLNDFAAIKNCLKRVDDISDEMLEMLR